MFISISLRKTTMELPPSVPSERSPADLLRCMLNRNINLLKVIADRSLSSADSSEITQHLCRAAAEMGLHNVITDLGQAQAIADDPLADVPEVMPVKVSRVCAHWDPSFLSRCSCEIFVATDSKRYSRRDSEVDGRGR